MLLRLIIFGLVGIASAKPFVTFDSDWIPIPTLFPPRTTVPASSGNLNAVDQAALSFINGYRRIHNTPDVTYNTTLRDAALQCANKHVTDNTLTTFCRIIPNVGESNGFSTQTNAALGVNDVINSKWGPEVALITFPDVTYSEDTDEYTQMVWLGTTQVGCAYSNSSSATIGGNVFTCLWSPPGNAVGVMPQNVLPPTSS